MATISEDYVSFEVAKLLKDKGFNEPTIGTYNIESKNPILVERPIRAIHCEAIISAPTLQVACKWLREEHNIFIVVEPHMYDYINEKNSSYVTSLWQGDNYYENITLKDYPTYEEAVEATIKYCLEKLL